MEARALAMYTTFSTTLMHVHRMYMCTIIYDCMYKYTTYIIYAHHTCVDLPYET